MKKILAILLIGLLMLSQYARQFVYTECKQANATNLRSVQCDCEKISGISDTSNDNNKPATHFHYHWDDFFSYTSLINNIQPTIPPVTAAILPDQLLYKGHTSLPWQPPRC